MTKVRAVAAGATWIYGAQFATAVVQVGYAALSSRMVNADAFAAYGVALAVSAFALLLANGGLGQAVARMQELRRDRIRALAFYAAAMGLAGATFLFISAPLWASIWGTSGATGMIRWMCISVVLAPTMGLGSGLLRRQGRFRQFAWATFLANCVGMLIGAVAIITWRSAETLIISTIVPQVALTGYAVVKNAHLLYGAFSIRAESTDLKFSWKLTSASILAYFNGNIARWAVANFLPPASLGQWNRADVVTTVPLYQVQNAVIQAVYPEFRHDIDSGARAKIVWVDLLSMVAWVVLPVSAIGAVIAPVLTHALFGAGWQTAVSLSGPLVVVGGLQIISTILASAIEALGKFKWIWTTQIFLAAIYGGAALVSSITRDWLPILIGLVSALILQHTLHIFWCSRAGYLHAPTLLRRYMKAVTFAVVCGLISWLLAETVRSSSLPGIWLIPILVTSVSGLILWKTRSALEPVRIAARYLRK